MKISSSTSLGNSEVADVLSAPEQFQPLREQARRTVVERYAVRRCLPRQIAIAQAVASGEEPPL